MADNGDATDPDAWRSYSAVSPLLPNEVEYSQENAILSPVTSPTSPLPQVTVTSPTGEISDEHDFDIMSEGMSDLPNSQSMVTGCSLEDELDEDEDKDEEDSENLVNDTTEDAGISTVDANPSAADDDGHASDGGESASGSHFSSNSSETNSDDTPSVYSGADSDRSWVRDTPPDAAHRDGRSPVGRVRNPPNSPNSNSAENVALRKEMIRARKHSPLRTKFVTRDGTKTTVVSPDSGIRVIDDPTLAEEMDAKDNEGDSSISPVERYLALLKASQPIDDIVTADDSILGKNDEGVVGLGITLGRPATPAPGDVRPDGDGDNISNTKSAPLFDPPRTFSAETGQLKRAEKKDSLRLLRESKFQIIMAKIMEEEPPKPEADFDDKHVWWQFLRWQHEYVLKLKQNYDEENNSIYDRLEASQQLRRGLQIKIEELQAEVDEAWEYVVKARAKFNAAKERSAELELEAKEIMEKISKQEDYIKRLEEELETAVGDDEKEELQKSLAASQKLLNQSENRVIKLQAELDETRKPLLRDDISETDEAGKLQAELDRTRNDLNNANHVVSQLKQQQLYTLGIASSIKDPWPKETRTQVADLIVGEVNRDLEKDAERLNREDISEFLDWGYGIRKIFQEIKDTGYKFDEREILRSLLTSGLIYNNFDVFSAYVFANTPITEDEFLRRIELLQQSFDDISGRVMPIGKMEDILARERKEKKELFDANLEATKVIDNLNILLGNDKERRRRDRERIPMVQQDIHRLSVKENARLIKENETLRAELEAERHGRKNAQEEKKLVDSGDEKPEDEQKPKDSPQEGQHTEHTGAEKDSDNEPEDEEPEESNQSDASRHDSEEPEGTCTIVRHAKLEGRVKDLEAQISNMPNLAAKVAELEAKLEKAKNRKDGNAESEEQDDEISALSVFGPPFLDAEGNADDSGWKDFDACSKKGKILFLKESRSHLLDLLSIHKQDHARLTYTENAYLERANQLRKNWDRECKETQYWQNEAENLEKRLREVRSSLRYDISTLEREKRERASEIRRLEDRAERLVTRLNEFYDKAAEELQTSGNDQETKRCSNCGRLQDDNERLKGRIEHLRARGDKLDEQCGSLEVRASNAEGLGKSNKELARDALEEVDALKKTLNEQPAEKKDNTALQVDINKLKKRNTKLKKEIAELKAVAEKKAANDKIAAEEREHAEGLKDKPWLKPASIRYLPATSEEQQAELNNLKEELAEEKATVARLVAGTTVEAETKDLRDRLAAAKTLCTQQEERIAELEVTNKTLVSQNIDNQDGTQADSGDAGDATKKIQGLERQLKSSREELKFTRDMYSISKQQETSLLAKVENLMRGGQPDSRFNDERLRALPRKNALERKRILKEDGEEAALEFDKRLERDDRRWNTEVRRIFGGDVPANTEPIDPLQLSKHRLAVEIVEHGMTSDRLKFVEAQLALLKKGTGNSSKTESSVPKTESSEYGDIHARCREDLRKKIARLREEVRVWRYAAKCHEREAEDAISASDKPKEPSDEPAFITQAELEKIDDPSQLRQICTAVDAQRTKIAAKLEVALEKNQRLEEQYFNTQAQVEKLELGVKTHKHDPEVEVEDRRNRSDDDLQTQLDTARDQSANLQTELDTTRGRLTEAETELESQKQSNAAQSKAEKEDQSASGLPALITKEQLDKIEDASQLRQMCLAADMFREQSQTQHETAVKRNQQLQQRIFLLSNDSKARIHRLETELNNARTRLDVTDLENDKLKNDLRIIRSQGGSHSGDPTRIADLETHLESARASAESTHRETEAAQATLDALKTVQSQPGNSGRIAELQEEVELQRAEARRHAEWRRDALRLQKEGRKHNDAMRNRLEQAKIRIADVEQINTGLLERQNQWLGIVAGVEQRATGRGESTDEVHQALENSRVALGEETTAEMIAHLHKFFDAEFRAPWKELLALREEQDAQEAAGTGRRSKSTKKTRASAEELEEAILQANAAEKRVEDLERINTASTARLLASQASEKRIRTENLKLQSEIESLKRSDESGTSGSGSKDKDTSSNEAKNASTEATGTRQRGRRPRSVNVSESHTAAAAILLSARYRNELSPPRSKFTPKRHPVNMPPPPHPRWLPKTRAGAERASVRPLREDLKHQNDRDMNGAIANASLHADTSRHNEWANAFMQQLQVNDYKTRTTEATNERAKDKGIDIPRAADADLEEDPRLEEEREQERQRLMDEIKRQYDRRGRDQEAKQKAEEVKNEKKKKNKGKKPEEKKTEGESSKAAQDGTQTEKEKTATDEQTQTEEHTADQAAEQTQTGDHTANQSGGQTVEQTETQAENNTAEEAESDDTSGSDDDASESNGDSEDETLGWSHWPMGMLAPMKR